MKNILTLFCSFIVALAAAKEAPQLISLGDFKLLGDLSGGRGVFTLDATAHVENSRGGTLTLMRGPIALFAVGTLPSRLKREQLLAATRVAQSGEDWQVQSEHGPLTLRPFSSIMSEDYRLYQTVEG